MLKLAKYAVLSFAWSSLFCITGVRGDIYQWEYINPGFPAAGKQPSATLAIGGAGVNAEPNVSLYNRNLTKAYLIGADLSNVYGFLANLTNADLSGANLTGADFSRGNLSGATFTQAEIRGADLNDVSNFTAAQLYSTASYQAGDLTGVGLYQNNLNGWNFSQQNLTRVSFSSSNLANANFTGAVITNTSFYDTFNFTAAQLYSTASYQNKSLEGIYLASNNLSNWNFAGQNLTGAGFYLATLTNADLTCAEIRDTSFYDTTASGFTASQLYSTASYQAGDLRGVGLQHNDLTGWNFAGQDLSNSNFESATLANADFTGANISGAILDGVTYGGFTEAQLVSTRNYQEKTLAGVILESNQMQGWNFAGLDLRGTSFYSAGLSGADFTGSDIRGAILNTTTSNGLLPEQIYSTASYQNQDLRGISFGDNNLSNWNFEGQNLEGANLSALVTNANFRNAYLVRAGFNYSGSFPFEGTDFTGADMRGSGIWGSEESITVNTIDAEGTIAGLDLTVENYLLVRDNDDYTDSWTNYVAIPILVTGEVAMNSSSVVELRFDADEWNSTISFEAGISVALDGILELGFADDVNVTSQIGRTLDLFDWTGVSPTGLLTVTSDYEWDLANLYTTGEVTLLSVLALPGDFDGDGDVDGRDFLALQRDPNIGSLAAWQANYGDSVSLLSAATAVPEPAGVVLAAFGLMGGVMRGPLRSAGADQRCASVPGRG